MSWKHSATPRGMTLKAMDSESPSKFGRLFPKLPAAKYGGTHEEEVENLGKLAKKMIAGFDGPKDGPDDEESGIPAQYTYFGQFIDHDLTFDPESSFRKKKDVDAVIDFRTPAFDLDNLYGRMNSTFI